MRVFKMAQFPRKESDGSLDMDAYTKLSEQAKEAAMQDLEENGSNDEVNFFFDQLKIMERQKTENEVNGYKQEQADLDKRYKDLEEQKQTYLTAYTKDLESTLNISPTQNPVVNTSNKQQKKSSKKSGCNIF